MLKKLLKNRLILALAKGAAALVLKPFFPIQYHVWKSRSFWMKRSVKQYPHHLDMYWNKQGGEMDNPSERDGRNEAISAVSEFIHTHFGKQQGISIFEFGCNVGNNISMLSSSLPDSTRFYGCDINEEAIAFLKNKLPFVTAAVCDNSTLPSLLQKEAFAIPFDAILISSVFFMLSPREVQLVLTTFSRISRSILVIDGVDNSQGKTAFIRGGAILHPYERYMKKLGFVLHSKKLLNKPANPNAYNGYLFFTRA